MFLGFFIRGDKVMYLCNVGFDNGNLMQKPSYIVFYAESHAQKALLLHTSLEVPVGQK